MAVFFDAVAQGDGHRAAHLSVPIPVELLWRHTASGSQIGVLVALAFWYGTGVSTLSDVDRRVFYDNDQMDSLGAVQWGTAKGWTELFGIVNPEPGRKWIRVRLAGGGIGGRIARAASVSYTGVDSFGTVVTNSGSAAGPLTVTGTGSNATKVVAAFGSTTVGFAAATQTPRFLSNTGMALLIADATGSGSSQTFSAARGLTGGWGAASVVVNPADIVATATGVTADPTLHSLARRYPRPGITRRAIFAAEPES